MATPVQVTIVLWLLSPFLSFVVNKLLYYLDFHLPRKLRELELQIIPSLENTLEDVTEQRMLRGAKDEGNGSKSHLQILGELAKDLKSALYDADDVLDLVKYRQIEKKAISGDEKSVGTSISTWQRAQKQNQKLSDLGDKLQDCAKDLNMMFWDRLAKLQQYAHPLRATLMQCARNQNQKLSDLADKLQECAKGLNMKFWDILAKLQQCIHQGAAEQPPPPPPPVPAATTAEFTLVEIEQGTAAPSPTLDTPSTSNPPTPNALPNCAGSTTVFGGGNQHGSADEEAPTPDAPLNSLLQNTWDCFGFVVSWLRSIYLFLRRPRGIKIARDCFGFVFALSCYFYLAVSDLRDWSYNSVGIKNDDDTATDWVLPINEIMSLRKRINNIEYVVSESKKSYLLNQNSSSSSSSTSKDADKESSSSCTVKHSAEESTSTQKEIADMHRNIEKKVFGREEDRAYISNMLRDGPDADVASSSTSKPYSVIGIYGITGSGKTTLAQYVCDYEKGAGHFNLIMFILVGKGFSVCDIFSDMLDQIKQPQASDTKDPNESQKTKFKDLRSLKTKLEKELQEKRFLLVLDDVWVNGDNQMERDILLDTLKAARSGSRILVTSLKENAAVALGARQKDDTFRIPDLEEKVYLSLFMHHAQPDEANDYGEYGRRIANRLCRSPIAAVTLGKQLQMNRSISFWKTTANLDVLNETMGALWWSYKQLGVDVKRCFAYCSIFPRGYHLRRDELVDIWIAQGFVSTRCNGTEEPEDIGQSYFEELLTFSFLQRTNFGTGIEKFTIHDLLHKLAEKVSRSEFFRIRLNNGSPKDIPRGVCHLFIETNNAAEIIEKILDMANLRSLIIKEPYDVSMERVERKHDVEKALGRLFMRLTKLRVLIIELNSDRIDELLVPASIGHMKHLRYLDFNLHCYICSLILPSTFSKLYHIQVIDIPCYQAYYPEDMANLSYLRRISGEVPSNIGMLTSLQTQQRFRVKEEQGYRLSQLKHLNKLQGTLLIEGLRNVGSEEEAPEAYLTNKKRLRILELKFDGGGRFGPDVEAGVLEGLCPPKCLQKLQIHLFRGSVYPSWMLSAQHADAPKQLHILELWYCSTKLPSIPQGSEFFGGLRWLKILGCDWDSLPENMTSLVSLQALDILGCRKMKLLPELPQALKMINILQCGMLSKTFKEEGHENWGKIQHIPKKWIG